MTGNKQNIGFYQPLETEISSGKHFKPPLTLRVNALTSCGLMLFGGNSSVWLTLQRHTSEVEKITSFHF
jgi:hypothetical protein